MKNKLHYTDPLIAAYMTREFGVEYLKDGLCDAVSGRYWQIDCATNFYENNAQLVLIDKHNLKLHIHPASLHIFKPHDYDLGVASNGIPFEFLNGKWLDVNDEEPESHHTVEIIYRDFKSFIMAKADNEK